MSTFEVRKLTTGGEVATTYTAELLERLPDGVVLEARWVRPLLQLGYTTFETGDRFVEWYFSNRWYNIFEISSAAGTLKGWYCNVAEPAVIGDGIIACRDLLLDLWIGQDGSTLVLDEDEFAADVTLDPPTRARALHALDELRALVARREAPFDRLASV
jgi:predicted RNA-binding protein associated with RNAse of E/G family